MSADPAPPAAAALPSASESTRDVATTIRNAFKLGGSLILTLGIGFGVKIALRRYLGPTVIGPVNYAEALSATTFVFVGLGVDMYIRKVIPVRPESASDFVGTFLVLRILASLVLVSGMAAYMGWRNQPAEVQLLVFLFAAAQLLLSINATFTAILHSTRTVDGLSISNVVAKLMWAGGFVATMVFNLPLAGIPLSVASAELMKTLVGFYLVRKHAGLRLRLDLKQVKPVFLASVAFYVNTVAYTIYSKLDIAVLDFRSTGTEIGLYSAAAELASMTFILAPMFGGVLMPLFARAASRSPEEYNQVLRRTLELMLTMAIPASLAIAVGAEFWVQLFLGEQYTSATLALRILAPNFVLTYVAVVFAIALNLNGGEWAVTLTSVVGMVVNPVVVNLFIGPFSELGLGGAGAGCAAAQVVTELMVAMAMLWRIGRRAIDARIVSMLVRTLLCCAAVIAMDQLFLLPLGPARLLLEAPLYIVLVVVTGAVRVREMASFARQSFRRKSAAA